MRFFVIICFMLSACAPMPGTALIPGVSKPAQLEEVSVVIHYGLWETTSFCNAGIKSSLVFANCLLNACLWFGCADVRWDSEGKIKTCDVYLAFESDYLLEHELRHCKGYADTLY
jgi:hypothetical protein